MKTGAYAGLRMAARAATPDPEQDPNEIEPDGDPDDESAPPKERNKKDMKPMDTNCNDTAVAQAVAAERTRTTTVLASEHYAGREKLAASLLATELGADQIVAALAAATPAAAVASDDPEAAARSEMQDALAANRNSGIDPGSGGGSPEAASAQAIEAGWNKATAAVNRRNGFKD